MRLLLANPWYLPWQGGIEARIEGLAKRLAARHEVAVLTSRLPGTAPEERRDGYTILRCPARVFAAVRTNPPPSWTRGIAEALEAWDPDVADLHYRWAPEWTRAMARWGRAAPLVVTWHNAFGEGQGAVAALSRWNDARYLRAVRDARRIVCISEAVRRDLAGRGVPEGKLRTVHPGFDAAADGAVPEGEHAVFVGRLVATKGLDVLLDALPEAPEVRVLVVGRGPLRARLERRAARRGVADRVRFAGFLPDGEKERAVAAARFVVHPARWEGFGHALAEAMLRGKPVVATEVGGIPEIAGPGGLLVPPGDAGALADAMRRLWGDGALREALGRKARAHAAGFTWERCVERTERAYREAVA